MCRHVAYLGPERPVAELCFDAPHSLRAQARAPRLQVYGDDNPHGWAVAWWEGGRIRDHRSTTPVWEDRAFAGDVRATAWMAAARYAAPGSAIDAAAAAPLVRDGWACSLNGMVEGFYDGVGERLRARCSPARADGLVTDVDTEVCFARFLDHLDAGAAPDGALAEVVGEVEAEAGGGRLNLLVGDGERLVATAVGNSLFVRSGPTVVASEPLDDDPAWRRVEDRSLVVATRTEVRTCALALRR